MNMLLILNCRLAPDPSSVVGLLNLRKLASLGALAAPTPKEAMYLIRHKRKRLAISQIETDPDAEAALAEGLGCGQSNGGGSGMDF